MAHSTISDDELLDRAAEVFRAHGFAGASLSRIASATGLEKASLYYRFPGGKDQIALEVSKRVARWLESHVFAPLRGPGDPAALLRQVADNLRAFYADGTKSCGYDVLSIFGGGNDLTASLQQSLAAWIEAFALISQRAGLPAATAHDRAEQALLQIEGALVLARVRKDPQVFLSVMNRIPTLLTAL